MGDYKQKFVMPNLDLIEKQWIPALRSGDYNQTRNTLRNDEGFCCLGVVCDVLGMEWNNSTKGPYYGMWMIVVDGKPGMHSVLPEPAVRDLNFPGGAHIGLAPGKTQIDYVGTSRVWGKENTPPLGWREDTKIDLARLNDSGMSFRGIANVLTKICRDWRIWIKSQDKISQSR